MKDKTLLIRGSTVDAARRFMRRWEGTADWDALVASLDGEQRDMIDKRIDIKGWYRIETYADILEKAKRTLGKDHPDRFLGDIGRFVLDDGAGTLYRAFFRIARPSFIIRGSALLWGMFFKGNKLKILRTGRRFVSAGIVDSPYCSHSLCMSTVGGMVAGLERAGAKDVKFELVQCGCNSANRCEFRFDWQ